MQDVGKARGEAVRGLREAKPWTQAQLAKASGVSTRTIMRVEAGEETSAETVLALCAALDVPVSVLSGPITTGVVKTDRAEVPPASAPASPDLGASPADAGVVPERPCVPEVPPPGGKAYSWTGDAR